MKITYKFINNVYSLLTSENWDQCLRERIGQIDKELESSPEDVAEERRQKILQDGIKKKRNPDKQKHFADQAYESLLKSSKKKKESLEKEKSVIQTCIEKKLTRLGYFHLRILKMHACCYQQKIY